MVRQRFCRFTTVEQIDIKLFNLIKKLSELRPFLLNFAITFCYDQLKRLGYQIVLDREF